MKVVGLAGWSNAGKTTLLTKLLPYWTERGLRVSTIKHAHHDFDIDVPGKDSWLHRKAGAQEVMVCADQRWVLMHELREEAPPSIQEMLAKMTPVDLVVVEGFKYAPYHKIEVHRAAAGKPLLYPEDKQIVGIATDAVIDGGFPVAPLDDIPAVAAMAEAAAMLVKDLQVEQL